MTKDDIGIIVGISVLFGWHLWSSREPDGTLSSDIVADSLVFGAAAIAARFGAMRLKASGRTAALRNVQVLFAICFICLLWNPNVSWGEPVWPVLRGIAAVVASLVLVAEILLRWRDRRIRSAY